VRSFVDSAPVYIRLRSTLLGCAVYTQLPMSNNTKKRARVADKDGNEEDAGSAVKKVIVIEHDGSAILLCILLKVGVKPDSGLDKTDGENAARNATITLYDHLSTTLGSPITMDYGTDLEVCVNLR